MPPKNSRHTPEAIGKMRASHVGQQSARKGAVLSDDTKQKIRAARAAQVHPRLVARGVTAEVLEDATRNGLKWCSGECKSFVPLGQFAGNKKNGKCKVCVAAQMQLKRDRATPEQLAITALDHCHETGLVRGLLCAKCNTALQRVEYVQDWAIKALAYLGKYRQMKD